MEVVILRIGNGETMLLSILIQSHVFTQTLGQLALIWIVTAILKLYKNPHDVHNPKNRVFVMKL